MKIELFKSLDDARAFISDRFKRHDVEQKLIYTQRVRPAHFMEIWQSELGYMTTMDYLRFKGAWKVI